MKKLGILLSGFALVAVLGACGAEDSSTGGKDGNRDVTITEMKGAIDVVSREDGSGTRSAFEEIIEFNQKDENGEVVSPLVSSATIKDGNGVVVTHVAGNEESLGYVSFVTLEENQDTVKGLTVSGVEPTTENVLSGEYEVARPFNMVYMEENITELEEVFIEFLESIDAADIIEEKGGIADREGRIDFDESKYEKLAGNLVLGGSTSVEGIAKAIADEFTALYPNVTYTYDATGSSTGVKNAMDGTYTFGFASRPIKKTELESGIEAEALCLDGIAIIVNRFNEITDITIEQIKEVYTGAITEWPELDE